VEPKGDILPAQPPVSNRIARLVSAHILEKEKKK